VPAKFFAARAALGDALPLFCRRALVNRAFSFVSTTLEGMKINMNEDIHLILVSFVFTYIVAGIWKKVLVPNTFLKNWTNYQVVRNIDYNAGWVGWLNTIFFFAIYPFVYRANSDIMPLCVFMTGSLNAFILELVAQGTGARKMDRKKHIFWIGGSRFQVLSHFLVFALQGIIEGGPYMANAAVFASAISTDDAVAQTVAIGVALLAHAALLYWKFCIQGRMPRDLGSTEVLSRRILVESFGYRIGEVATIYYILQKYQPSEEVFRRIIVTIFWKILHCGVFFGTGTLLGHDWVDAGPKKEQPKGKLMHVLGLSIRIAEGSVFGNVKCYALGLVLYHYIQSRQAQEVY
jgi:hypothetical protein